MTIGRCRNCPTVSIPPVLCPRAPPATLHHPVSLPVTKAPAVPRMLSSNLCLQAQYGAVSLGSTFGQESSYLVNSITRAPGCLRQWPSGKGRDLLTAGAQLWMSCPAVGPQRRRASVWTLQITVQGFLGILRKNHPGRLLNKFPGPTAELLNQHLQGPGELCVECTLEILLSSFRTCRPSSAFTDVEPRPGTGSLSGVTQKSGAAACSVQA